jgi:hypothetical protein
MDRSEIQLPAGVDPADVDTLPGGDLIDRGLRDLAAGRESPDALLVMVGRPQLTSLGFLLPDWWDEDEPAAHRLYDLLCSKDADGAHAQYTALIGRLVSFEQSLSMQLAWRDAQAG